MFRWLKVIVPLWILLSQEGGHIEQETHDLHNLVCQNTFQIRNIQYTRLTQYRTNRKHKTIDADASLNLIVNPTLYLSSALRNILRYFSDADKEGNLPIAMRYFVLVILYSANQGRCYT
jgi:hypothetical protein